MYNQPLQSVDVNIFGKANAILKNPPSTSIDKTFEETLEDQAKQVAQKAQDDATEITTNSKETKKKKENNLDPLPDITKITGKIEKSMPYSARNSQSLLEKFSDKKKEDDPFNGNKQQFLQQNPNVAGQPLVQPVYDQGQRRPSKAQMLAAWEKLAPVVTEDITRKAVRIDIPMINDIQVLVLKIHPDRSLTASMLGSYAMGELIKQHKEKLDRNLRHHHLSLKEFNTYRSELELNTESGTRKNPKKKQGKKATTFELL